MSVPKLRGEVWIALLLVLFTTGSLPAQTRPTSDVREELRADNNWRFYLGDPSGAEAREFDDSSWRRVDLPHDWAIEGAPDKANPSGPGGGFYPAGTAWYRKSFRASSTWRGKCVSVEFDGVYRNATVFLNGQKLGVHATGYIGFSFDLTKNMRPGATNVLAVRVDNAEQPNSRWYSGSGIYRHVRLIVTRQTHVARWGVFVQTPVVTSRSAIVNLGITLSRADVKEVGLAIRTVIRDEKGKLVGSAYTREPYEPQKDNVIAQSIQIAHPQLWSPDTPVLYKASTTVYLGHTEADRVSTSFGIRTLRWGTSTGLLLNGDVIKIHGGSVHGDNGPLGAAAFDRAEERKVQLLKAAGMNAVRTAHQPPSPAFLDACDRLGMLVMDEMFDTWESHKLAFDAAQDFQAWGMRDLQDMLRRDRNHPSVLFWSMGNEIPDTFDPKGPSIAAKLANEVHSLDTTRLLSQAVPGSTSLPSNEAVLSLLDIAGYNYNLEASYERDHRDHPNRLMLATETYPTSAFSSWLLARDNPYIAGEFVWTAIDYLGESGLGVSSVGSPQEAVRAETIFKSMRANPGGVDAMFVAMTKGQTMDDFLQNAGPVPKMLFPGFPWHSAESGDIDLIGNRKPQSFYRDILWNGGDRAYTTIQQPQPARSEAIAIGWATAPSLASWTWPGQEGRELQVDVYSRAETVRLFLNDRLVGEKSTGQDEQFTASFHVPYSPGTLKTVTYRVGKAVSESTLVTAGEPVSLRLTPDRTMLSADGQDISFIAVEAIDQNGRPQPNAAHLVHFRLAGPGTIAAVGNSNGQDSSSYAAQDCRLFRGRAMAVVRTLERSGRIILDASADNLTDATTSLEASYPPLIFQELK